MDEHCPVKTLQINKSKHTWLSHMLKNMINLKNTVFCGFQVLRVNASKKYYLDLKNFLSMAIKTGKSAFWGSKIEIEIRIDPSMSGKNKRLENYISPQCVNHSS